MRSNSRWYSILAIGLVLLLTISFTGCGQSQSEAYQEGFKAGVAQSGAEAVPTPSTSPEPEPASTPPPSSTTPAPLEPARFVLGDLTITPTAVNTGEVITILIPVSNTGGTEGSYTVVFKVKLDWTPIEKGDEMWWHEIPETVEVTLKVGETKNLKFTTKGQSRTVESGLSKVIPGTYTVDINGKVGQFTVTEPPPTPEELEAKQVIEDLAYIQASAFGYTDDADPEYDGVDITVRYYNSRSKSITPSGISVNITVDLYWDTKPNRTSIYHKQVTINYKVADPRLAGLGIGHSSQVVRIPFEGIQERPVWSQGPLLIVTVSTPNQGVFTIQETISRWFWP